MVQLRVEGNRILSGAELKRSSETKMAFVSPSGVVPVTRPPATPVQPGCKFHVFCCITLVLDCTNIYFMAY